MNTTLLAGVIVILIAAAAGAVIIANHGGSSSENHATQSSTTSTQGPKTTTETSGGNQGTTPQQGGATGSTADLSGTWRGTYTCSRGTGHFEWIIKKTSNGNYVGALKVMDYYPTNGYIDIEVRTSGDTITVGTVGGASGVPAVTFTGKLSNSGNHAEGTWKFTNQMDSGTWKADKVSSSTQIPGQTSPPTSTMTGSETSSMPQTTTETQQGGGEIKCSPPPPDDYKTSYKAALDAVVQVFGESNINCVTATMLGQPPIVQYAAQFDLSGVTQGNLGDFAGRLKEAMESHGWGAVQVNLRGSYLGVTGIRNATLMGHPIGMMVLVSVELNDNGPADLVIQVQPYTG
ncbi:MAG: hypothetical protein GSR76_02720 [Desulfurococcales archaeon]|nr:hypothetical protein [Desulfurococcales archaeon]